MENKIAEALLKIAEVHDRRLGEIGNALARIAGQITPTDDLGAPDTAVDKIAREICNLSAELGALVEAISIHPPGSE